MENGKSRQLLSLLASHEHRKHIPDVKLMADAALREIDLISSELSDVKGTGVPKSINYDRLLSILADIASMKSHRPGLPLMRSEEYRAIVDATSLVSKTDAQGKIIYANERFCEISGYDHEELIGKTHSIVRHPDTPAEVFGHIWKTISKDKQIWRGELKNKHKDGTSYYVDAMILPQLDEEGNILGYAAFRHDVTDIASQRERVEYEQQLNQIILDEQTSMVAVVTMEDGLVVANKAFFKTTPFNTIEDFRKKHKCICELFIEYDRVCEIMGSVEWFKKITENTTGTHKVKMIGRNRETLTFGVAIKSVRNIEKQNNKKRYYVISFNDITQPQKEADLAREEAIIAHNESFAKSSFLATMSHEIRTPLNGIIPIVDLLASSKLDAEQKEQIAIIKRSANSLLQIINDILDFSKIESGNFDIDETDFNPIKEIESVADLFAIKAAEKRLELCLFVDPALPKCAIGDPLRIKQIVANLIGNAVKFTDNGAVFVEAVPKYDANGNFNLCVSVKDTGIGIKGEDLNDIFSPFSQADGSITRKFGGTGLGLAICKNLIELMGGELAVKSEFGKGSEFFFSVPMRVCSFSDDTDEKLKRKRIGIFLAKENDHSLAITKRYLDAFKIENKIVRSKEDCADCDVLFVISSGSDYVEWIDKELLEALHVVSVIPAGSQNRGRFPSQATIIMPLNGSKIYDAIFGSSYRVIEQLDALTFLNSMEQYNANVLVAEDNPTNQQIAKTILKRLGITPIIAVNGEEALNIIQDVYYKKEQPFDLVFMDVHMPVLGGIEATSAIREFELKIGSKTRIPIVMLTADAIKGKEQEYYAAGADYFISKPIDTLQFDNTVERYLSHKKTYETVDRAITVTDEIVETTSANTETIPVSKRALIAAEALNLDEDTAQFLVEDFFSNWPNYKERIQKGIDENDCEEVRSSSHSIKGAAATLRMDDIFEEAKSLEMSAKENLSDDLQKLFLQLVRAVEQ